METRNTKVNETDPRLIAFERLLNIMDDLREKCPWDQKQTFESLAYLSIEEVYELVDAIQKNDLKSLEGEIGDVLLHMVFYSKIGSEQGIFDITSVLNGICDKLVYRHPHIYSDTIVSGEEEVKANWEKLKLKEGKKSVFEGVPNSLPALIKANRIQEKARGVGFDWDNVADVRAKVDEELAELDEALAIKNQDEVEKELGDVLFSVINLSRFIHVNPENALSQTNQKFIDRFQVMEQLIRDENLELSEMTLTEMDIYWEKAKKILSIKK
jgi:XTP/dITP diphosphohydrolase